MKKIAFGMILILFALCSSAQTTDTIDCDFWWPENGHVHLGVPEYMPSFPGGETALKDYISDHLKYPPLAVEGDITGRVFVGFVVMEDGSLDCFKLIRGLGYGCDEAALEVFKDMPKWMPAMQRGKAISYPYIVPVRFYFDCENKMLKQEIVSSVEEAPASPDGQELIFIVENMPEYPGGFDAMFDFINANLVYPQEAIDAGIEGRVFVGFVVEKDGSVSSIKLLRGIGYGCDEAAMDVVRKMPKWKPATQRGKPVRVQYQLPLNFKLENKKTE